MCPAQAQKQAKNPGVNPLDDLQDMLLPEIKSVNAAILEKMQSEVSLIPELAGYLIAAGGKRLRPLLTLACARMLGYGDGKRHVNLAACVEFIHTATLLHDDVVDDSGQRRGRPSANAVFGNQASVLVGDFLFSRAFELMVEDGDLDVLAVLSKASSTIAEGEVLQLAANDINLGFDRYLRIVESKTAALFAAACETGGIVADCSPAQREALKQYGLNLGIAFQMADDLLDYSASQDRLGKSIGDDFREGKVSFPVILALQSANNEELVFWQKALIDKTPQSGDLEKAQEILVRHKVFSSGLETARTFAAKAAGALQGLPETHLREKLQLLVDFVVERDY